MKIIWITSEAVTLAGVTVKNGFSFLGVAFENRKPNRQTGWVKEEDRMRTLKTRQKNKQT